MPVVRLRNPIAAPNLLLTMREAVVSCETCPAYVRLKTLYDATCAVYRNEHRVYEAWTADDNGKMVITPAGIRALEAYMQILNSQSDAGGVE